MREVLVIEAALTGLPLLRLGLLGTIGGCMMSRYQPEFGEGIAGYGMLAMLCGSLPCYAAWMWPKHDNKE